MVVDEATPTGCGWVNTAAVSAALTESWSNGPVEGPINRLKAIKRAMYGRAWLDLLRARVLRKG